MQSGLERSGISRWRQIGEALIADIEKGVLAPDKRLPPSEDLARRFGVNRHTVLRALSHLQAEGYVRLERGRGAYAVVNPLDIRLGPNRWFEQNLLERGRTPSRTVISVVEMMADETVAKALRIEEGAPVVVATLLGEADRFPINYGRHTFPSARFPTMAEVFRGFGDTPSETFSFPHIFSVFGIREFRRDGIRVRSRPPSAEEARYLKMAPSDHVLETEVVLVDTDGAPLVLGRTCFCSSRVELVLDAADAR
jgi:GntR family transcriptional regulator, phosphonate transport system regulatory protein